MLMIEDRLNSLFDLFSIDDFLESVASVKSDCELCGFSDNKGGMDIIAGSFLRSILNEIRPKMVVESGIWRGFSSMIIQNTNTLQIDEHLAFDPGVQSPDFMELLNFKSNTIKYISADFGSSFYSRPPSKSSLAFFDDHQDQFERLILSFSRGYDWVCFDDCYMYGGGGHHSLFDHFRGASNSNIFQDVVESVYVSHPILDSGRGVKTLADLGIDSKLPLLPLSFPDYDSNFNWLTLVKLKQTPVKTKSQGAL